jgi:hypothetical protein
MTRNRFTPDLLVLEDRALPNSMADVLGMLTPLLPVGEGLLGQALAADYAPAGVTAVPSARAPAHEEAGMAVSDEHPPDAAPAVAAPVQSATVAVATRANTAPAAAVAAASPGSLPGSAGGLADAAQPTNTNLVENYSGTWFNTFGYQVYSGWGVQLGYGIGPGQYMYVQLNPQHPGSQGGTTANFSTVLGGAFPGWTVNAAGSALSDNALTVDAYYVQGSSSFVCTFFHARYQKVADTDPATANLHWIQVVTDNDAIGADGQNHFGTNENIVDNGGAANPYYDTRGAASATEFYDRPARTDGKDAGISWKAELWLVGQTAANTVTTYGGITWGWQTARAN